MHEWDLAVEMGPDDLAEELNPVAMSFVKTNHTSAKARSSSVSSSASSRPAKSPSRVSALTAAVCSTNIRVSVPSMVIVGRKSQGRALVEVGATRSVERFR